MEIPGINSILNQGADAVWPGEPKPSADLIAEFEKVKQAISSEHFDEATNLLAEIARDALTQSQEMRVQYLYGLSFSDRGDYNQAHVFYTNALDIATSFGDLDSQILLTIMAGEVRYGKLRNREALAHFQVALELWRLHSGSLPHPPVEPEVTILEFMGKLHWLIGELEEAHAAVARVIALTRYRHGAPHFQYLREKMAGALWTLILVFRAQSDALEGDAGYLRTALSRSKTAIHLFDSASTYEENIARFYIQIAEVYLDLAELHLQRGAHSAARKMRHEGFTLATKASDFLSHSTDTAAKLLAELALARHAIQGQSTRTAVQTMQDIDAWLTSIEREAANLQDHIISAKAATLRAEWLIQFGDKVAARKALQLALEGFSASGMGMATRALRLQRSI